MTRKITVADRLLLLGTCLLAAYQVAMGIEGLGALPIAFHTLGFGALLLAGLLMILFGFEVLESPWVIIVATLIPLSLSAGLVVQYLPARSGPYLVFAMVGFLALASARMSSSRALALGVLIAVHSLAGLIIFGLPLAMALRGATSPGFALVGLGGGLIGLAGILLAFLRSGKPILSQARIQAIMPGLLLLTTAAFVAGFALA
jgi:hypothetical protein